jgi:hypothetical protein
MQLDGPDAPGRLSHGLSVAVAARRRAIIGSNDVMVDPFGNQTARLVDRRFRMMDAVQRRAGPEGLQVAITVHPEFAICGDDSALATASDGAELAPHPAKAPVSEPQETAPLMGGQTILI